MRQLKQHDTTPVEIRKIDKPYLEQYTDDLNANTEKIRAANLAAAQGLPKLEAAPVDDLPDPASLSSAPELSPGQASPGVLPPTELRPVFERAARQYNVPVNVLMAMGLQESSYNPLAQNGKSSAKGLMQYIDGTAKQTGINPFDPYQAVDAAAKQIRARLDAGGTMEEAVMGHHGGDGQFKAKSWNASDVAYGKQVLDKAGQIGDLIMAEQPAQQAQVDMAPQSAKVPAARSDLAPIMGMDKGYFRKLQDQFDAMTPQQAQQAIAALGDRQDISARAFKHIAEQRAKEAATISDLSPLNAADRTVALATGQGRAARAAQYAAQGLNPQAADALAGRDAMIGADGMRLGEARQSDADFATKRAFNGSNQAINNPLVRGVSKGALGLGKAAAGFFEAESDLVGLDAAAKVWANAGDWLHNKEQAIGESSDGLTRNVEGAISSIAQQLPLLVSGSQPLALAGMALQSFGQEYSDGRANGQSGAQAATRAGIFATFEVIGEKFGLGEQMQAIMGAARGMPSDQIIDFMWSALKKEVPGEQLTTAGQFLADKLPGGVGLNTEAGIKAYIAQAGDTLAQTLLQSGMMTGGTTGVSAAVRYMNSRGESERLAGIRADVAQEKALNAWSNGLGGNRNQQKAAPAAPGAAAPVTPPAAKPAPNGPLTRAQQAADLVGGSAVNSEDLASRIEAIRPAEEAPAAESSDQAPNNEQVAPNISADAQNIEQQAPSIEPVPSLSEMDEPALRERLKYVEQQAKANGGWVPMLTNARKEVEREINKRAKQAEQTQESVDLVKQANPQQTAATFEAVGAYRDGSKWSKRYRTVKRGDGMLMLVRETTDEDGRLVEHLTKDGTWSKGEPSTVAVSGVLQISGPETFNSEEYALDAAKDDAGPTTAAMAQPTASQSPQRTAATLPKDLAGAKPRSAYGKKQFDLTFESDVDKAAYIAAQKTPSKRDADYVKFVMDSTGMTEDEVRAHGAKVRAAIKEMGKNAEPGMLKVPEVAGGQTRIDKTAAPDADPAGKVTSKPVGQLTNDEWAGVIGAIQGPARADAPNEEISIDDAILLKKMVVKAIKDGVAAGKTREQIVAQIEGLTKGGIKNDGMNRINALLDSQPAPTVGTTEEGAGATQPPQAAPTKTASKEDLDHLFGVDNKRAKAMERIANGKAWFNDGVKAKDFVKKNGLSDTHEAVKGKGGRWEIVAKTDATKPADAMLPRSESQAINDFLDGKRDTPPTAEEVAQETETAGIDRRIAETQKRLETLRKNQKDAEAVGNAWVWDKKIADAEATLAAYQQAKQSIESKAEPAATAEAAPATAQKMPPEEVTQEQTEESGITSAIESAKRRLRETRNEIEKVSGGVTPSSQMKLAELRAKENAIEREIRNLRSKAAAEMEPVAAQESAVAQKMPPEEAARYLKDFVYSLDQLDGMTDRVQVALSSQLAKSGRDNLLMSAFGLTREQAHDINNRLDASKPRKLRQIDMQEAFDTFPGLREMIDAAIKDAADKAANKPAEAAPEPKATDDRFAGNKIFTADKVAAARARMKYKLGQLNSGIDPELMIDGMTIAGAYIESGVRSFSEYAKTMIDDMGDGIKPYLLSFWEGARNYPGLNTEGMTSAEESARLHAELSRELPAEVADAIGSEVKKPAKRTKKTGAKSDMTLTQDWGVDHINGYGDHFDRESGNDVKDQFLKESAKYLAAMADKLQENGFVAHEDGKGRPQKPVSTNEGGTAGSGDVSLTMRHPDTGVNVYVHVGESSLRGVVPTTPSGIAVMFRVSGKAGDRYAASGTNRWSPVDLSAADLTNMVLREVAGQENAMTRPAQPGSKQNADTQPIADIADRGDTGSQPGRVQADGAREQAGTVPGADDGAVRAKRRGRDGQNLVEVGGTGGRGQGAADQHGNAGSGSDRAGSGRGGNSRNYRIAAGELKRTGSWRNTAEQNVKIVETVKQILAENRPATADERALLTKFTGWGASEIANGIFPNQYGRYKDAAWQSLGERLQAALTPEEYAQAKRTTQYAHYTSEAAIRSVYSALQRMGFNGGNVMEPGMGVGLFNGLMPEGMAKHSQYTGIEYDTITGNIAQLLYPDSNIIVGDFTQTKLPTDFFDAAIGNPPFGNIKIMGDAEYKKHGFLLHDYFFAKTIDRVKPGGLLVFVTSKGTMDKANDRARKYLAERADLLGAIRMPQTAFKDNAGTEVVTDVIFLRKRAPGEAPAGESWAGLKEITTPQGNAHINEYFADRPDMVLGRHALTGSMYRANEYTVEPIDGDIEDLFAKAILNLPENIYRPARGSQAERAAVQQRDYDPKIKKEGGLYLSDNGALMQVESGQGVALTHRKGSDSKAIALKPKEVQFLKDWTGVRDALKQSQYAQLNDGDWQSALSKLNQAYDAFVATHGELLANTITERENEDGTVSVSQRYKNKNILSLDAEHALAYAIESVDSEGNVKKGPALLGRTINKPSTPRIENVRDAMFVSLNDIGALDLAHVAKLAGKDERAVIDELGEAIYRTPSGAWVTADDYLSGNVVRKLKEAEAAVKLDSSLARNVEALKAVQPKPLAPHDITVQLGSHWIPASDVQQFAREVMESRFDISYSPITGQWNVEGRGGSVSEWSAKGKDATDILDSVLNNRQIKVTYRDGEGKTWTDAESTEKANDIAKKMREAFKKWIWTDAKRSERLVTFYNDNYNNIAPRSFDGSHLTLPGVSSRFSLRSHQKRAIWRTIQQGDTYYAHAVGAGKTFTMIAAGMEERRLGLSKKPMYVVPNHMLAQFSKEFLELYPTAQIMVADEQNFHTHNRRKFVAQAALNDPDAIVITHSAFGRIGMSKDFTQQFITEQIEQWQAVLDESDSGDRVTRKQIERRIEQLENRLKAIIENPKDQLMTFEELGVDRLFVDEAHEFRKLDFATNQGNIKGIDPSGSQRAMDLFMKVQYLREKKPGRALVMASGTPVTNTMGELYTVQRFFGMQQMAEDGDGAFDAWANHYGEVVTGLEQNAAGGYEAVGRFAKFINVPELMSRVRAFMDILTSEQLGDVVQRPDVKTGSRQIIVTPVPDGFKEYQRSLQDRIQAIKNRKGPPKPGDDIILSVIADGRFSAIDMRFVDPTLPSDPNSKLNRIIDDMITAYNESAGHEYSTGAQKDPLKGASMMLFTDIGLGEQSAANRGFNMKEWIEKRLIAGGIKPEHIAFMRDHKAHAKKERLFDDLRQGRKRILIGGKDMETGVNAQKRLAYLFHLDAPWFPASVEQREGRIVRQGNQNRQADLRGYATKGSYDSTMWGMNARKQRFIEQAMSGDASVRSMEDVSEASAFEMAAALASGDERYLKLAGLKGDVERLGRLYAAHMDDQRKLAWNKQTTSNAIAHNRRTIEELNAAMARREIIRPGEFKAVLDGRTHDNREEFSQAAYDAFVDLAKQGTEDERTIGSIGGMDIQYIGVHLERSNGLAAELRVNVPGENEPLIVWPLDPAINVPGIATRAANRVNGLDRILEQTQGYLAGNQANLKKIERRLGAAFPEQSELHEKQQALAELEAELAAENSAASAEAAAATVEIDPKADGALSPAIKSVASGIVPERERLSAAQLLDVVDNAISQLGHKPAIVIDESLSHFTGRADDAGGASGLVSDGRIHLFRDAIAGTAEAVKTVWHELLHYGIRRFLTVDQYIQQMRALANRDAFIRKQATLWARSAESEKARKYAQGDKKLNGRVEDYVFARGVDEALANLGEAVGPNGSLYAKNDAYRKAVRMVRDWLAKMADRLQIPHVGDWLRGLDNKEAREYVHAMFQKLRDNAAPGEGDLTRDDWLFTADGAFKRAGSNIQTGLNLPEQTRLESMQANLQDSMQRVHQLQKKIEKVTGREIREISDYYGAETNRPGRIAARLEAGQKKLFEPLIERLAKSGHTMGQLEELMHAMHAGERYEKLRKLIGNEKKPAEELAGMSLEQAAQIMTRYAGATELHAVADEAREISKFALEMRRRYGLVTDEVYQILSDEVNGYQYYVPLKGDNEYGPRIKRATGHGEREEHILENIFRDFELVVVAGEKNLARQHLLSLAMENPDSEVWTVGAAPKGRAVRGVATYSVRQSGQLVAQFRTMAEAEAYIEGESRGSARRNTFTIEGEYGEKVSEYTKPLQDHEVPVFVKGEMVRIQINDPVLAEQIRPMNGRQLSAIEDIMRRTNRWLSAVYTGYNPDFILKNAARDAMTGTINMVGNEGAATALKAWKHYPAALKAMAQHAATGKDVDGEMGRFLHEYRMHGGKTGASYMSDLEDQAVRIQRMFEDARGVADAVQHGDVARAARVAARKSVGALAHVVEVANQATENALRLALFAALRKQGVSPGEAARAAKAVTVDFDRKGKMTPSLGAYWLFFNPAMQGGANAVRTLVKGQHKKQAWALLGGLASLGFLAAMMGIDEDEDRWYGTDWTTRTKNLRFMLGGHTLSIPVSQEFAPFFAFGVAAAEAMRGQSAMKTTVHMVSSMLDAFVPVRNLANLESDDMGMDSAIALAPTILQAPANVFANRNGWGSQLMPDTQGPDSQKMWRATKGSGFDAMAQGLAKAGELAGAGKYENDLSKISPETLKYMWRTYTGGLGQFIFDSADLAKLAVTAPGDIEASSVPVLKGFVNNNDFKPVRSRFFNLKREAEAAQAEFAAAKKAVDTGEIGRIADDPLKLTLIGLAKAMQRYDAAAAQYGDEITRINASEELNDSQKRAAVKKVEGEMEVLYRDAIKLFKEQADR